MSPRDGIARNTTALMYGLADTGTVPLASLTLTPRISPVCILHSARVRWNPLVRILTDHRLQDGCVLDPEPAGEQLRLLDRRHSFLVLRRADLSHSPLLMPLHHKQGKGGNHLFSNCEITSGGFIGDGGF